MRKDYYFDSLLTPSLEAELQQMQNSIQITEIRIVPAEPEKKSAIPWFKGWAEVLAVVAVMGIAGLMLTGLIGGAMYLFARLFHVAN